MNPSLQPDQKDLSEWKLVSMGTPAANYQRHFQVRLCRALVDAQ